MLLEQVCRVLHTFEEGALIDTAQIRWHHVQVLKLCNHCRVYTDLVNDLRAATNINRRATSTATSL